MANLNLNTFIDIDVIAAPTPARAGNPDTGLVIGTSAVIDGTQRVRTYKTSDEVIADFGSSAPETLAAQAYFAQVPRAPQLMIGKWQTTVQQSTITTFSIVADAALRAITNGSFGLVLGGVTTQVTGMNFSGCYNVGDIAGVIGPRLTAAGLAAQITFDNATNMLRFFTLGGNTLSYGHFTAPTAGTDARAALKLRQEDAPKLILYMAGTETPLDAVQGCRNVSGVFWGITFVGATLPTDAQHKAISDYIESANAKGCYFITAKDAACYSSASTTDIMAGNKTSLYKRTITNYGLRDPYVSARVMGLIHAVDYSAADTAKDVCWKKLQGGLPEELSDAQATVIFSKNGNLYGVYGNSQDLNMYRRGALANGDFLDRLHGYDAYSDNLQIELYNILSSSPTKIPQTNSGVAQLVACCEFTSAKYVRAGLLAPGTWNSQGMGEVRQGDYLKLGYYVWPEPLSQQAQSDRQARRAPPIHILAKDAGSFQDVRVSVHAEA